MSTQSSRIIDSLLSFTNYLTIRGAVVTHNSQSDIKMLVKRLSGYRRLHLSVLIAFLTIHVQQENTCAAMTSAVSVFITANICLIYDDADENVFRQQVEAIGPATFTIINSLPGLLTQACCAITIISMPTPKVIAVTFCTTAYIPVVIQMAANSMATIYPLQPGIVTEGAVP